MGTVLSHMTMSLDGFIADPTDGIGELFDWYEAERWPRTTFVDGVAAAVEKAQQIAGDKHIVIASANVTQQALNLGLLDEVCVSLVPVLFGEGIPYFGRLDHGHLMLDDPEVVPGRRATHLRYRVRRQPAEVAD